MEVQEPVTNDPVKNEPLFIDYVHVYHLPDVLFFLPSGLQISLASATPKQFDDFISRYIALENVDRENWYEMHRWRAINFAIQRCQGLPLFYRPGFEKDLPIRAELVKKP